jgi:hypothetical protein
MTLVGQPIDVVFPGSASEDAWLPGLDLMTMKNSQMTVKLWPFSFLQHCLKNFKISEL